MKRFLTLITLLTFSVGVYATSTPTNDKEKSPVEEGTRGEIASPSHDATLLGQNEGPAVSGDAVAATTSSHSSATQIGTVTTPNNLQSFDTEDYLLQKQRRHRLQNVKSTRDKTVKAKRERQKRQRAEKPSRTHDGSGILGILALVFGLLGFLLGWFFWPIGILFGLTAIILGAIGLGGEQRGMALVGLIFGILTIVLPVLIVALIIAAFV